jgi:hypothetical protein
MLCFKPGNPMKTQAFLVSSFALLACFDYPVKAQIQVSDFNGGNNGQVRRFDDTGAPTPPIPWLNVGGGGAEGQSCRTANGVPELFLAINTNRINVYNRTTGALLRTFTIPGAQTIAAISLSLDGNFLYVADYGAQVIFKVSASNGDLSGTFVAPVVNSIATTASHDLAVGPDSRLYATGFNLATGVVSYDANLSPGSLAQFVANGDNGLTNPAGLLFVGNTLYVSNFSVTNGRVNVYGDPLNVATVPTNTFIATVPFPNNSRPLGMANKTDGTILVAEFGADAVAQITRTGNTFSLNAQFIPTPNAGPNPKYVVTPDTCRGGGGGGGCAVNPLTLLVGTWTYSTHGFAPGTEPFASAGQFTATLGTRGGQPIGLLSVLSTASMNGQITRQETDAGTFQIFDDCSGGTLTFNLSSRPLRFDFWFSRDGNQIRMVSTISGFTIVGTATRGGSACPIAFPNGRWIFTTEGFAPASPLQPFASAGQFVPGAKPGTLIITNTADILGSVTRLETDAGTFQLFPDCSGGTLTFNVSSRPLTFDFWFATGATELRLISTTSGVTVWGSANQ